MEAIQFALTGGRIIFALRHGPASDRAIVFCPGLGFSGSALMPDLEQLKRAGLCLIIPQRPGIGASTPSLGFTAEQVADDMLELVNYLKIKAVYVVGCAAGAVYALVFAGRYAQMLVGLGLVNPVLQSFGLLGPILPFGWQEMVWLSHYFPAFARWQFECLAVRVAGNAERTLEKALQNSSIADRLLFEQLQYRVALLNDMREAFGNTGAGVFADFQAIRRCSWSLAGISIPIDIWQGSADTFARAETVQVLQAANSHAQIHILLNEGHLMFLIHWPEMQKQIISKFE